MKRYLTTIITTLLIYLTVMAQPSYRQRTFSVHDGLPSNAITAIRQDHRGLVWIATWYGLCCYDGYRFTTFPGDDWGSEWALSTKRIAMIEPDSRDNIWVRAYDGKLYLFDTRNCRYHNMTKALERKFNKTILPRHIYSLPTGHTLITDERRELDLRIDDHYPTDVDRMELLDTAQLQQYVDMAIKARGDAPRYDSLFADISKQMTDQQGNLWFSSSNGLSLVNFASTPIRLLTLESNSPTRSLACRRNGTVVAGSRGGYLAIYGTNGRLTGWINPQGKVSSSAVRFAEYIYSIYEDHQGNLWVGTRGQGLYCINADGKGVSHYRHQANNTYSLSHDVVFDIDEDRQGNLWIATYGGGVNMVSHGQGAATRFIHSGNDMKQYPKEGFNKVRRITHDHQGNLFASTTTGLMTFRTGKGETMFHTTTHVDSDTTSLRTTDVIQVLACRNGNIYVATMGGGIQQIVSNNLQQDGLKLRSVTGMNRGAGNALSMIEDTQGKIWIAREAETACYDVKTGRLEQYGSNSMSEQAVLTEAKPIVDHQGNLWMGATGGVLTFNPKEMRKSSFCPNIVYTSYQFQGEQEGHSILNREVLTVNDKGQRNLTVSFAALDFEDNYLMQYAYRMKESGEGWNFIGRDPHVTFSQLSPGRHTLVVKSTNCDGVWMDNEQELVIDVRPTLLERTWMRVLLLLLVIGLTTAAILTYMNYRRKMHEREQRLENILRQYRELQEQIEEKDTVVEKREYKLEEPQIIDADEAMMNKLMSYVEQRIGDEELKIEDMAEAVGMGRTVFYSKIKELMGVSPSDFLRQVRMQRACQLLTKSKMNIAEIAYAIGFTDPKYFTKCFKKESGLTPSEYRNQQ